MITIWQFPGGTIAQTIESDDSAVSALALSPDGRYLAAGSGMRRDEEPGSQDVRLWRLSDGKLVKTWKGHWGIVDDVAFSPDSRTVASASIDRTIRFWTVPQE